MNEVCFVFEVYHLMLVLKYNIFPYNLPGRFYFNSGQNQYLTWTDTFIQVKKDSSDFIHVLFLSAVAEFLTTPVSYLLMPAIKLQTHRFHTKTLQARLQISKTRLKPLTNTGFFLHLFQQKEKTLLAS